MKFNTRGNPLGLRLLSTLAVSFVFLSYGAYCTATHLANADVDISGSTQEASQSPMMVIVAHHDDDIGTGVADLYPAVRKTLTDPTMKVQTVVITDGNNGYGDADGCQVYVEGRERGHQKAYAKMLGLDPNTPWQLQDIVIQGKKIRKATLPGYNVSLIYLGLENPTLHGGGIPRGDAERIQFMVDFVLATLTGQQFISPTPLQHLWEDQTGQLTVSTTVPLWDDNQNQGQIYTRSELIAVLEDLMQTFQPGQISVQGAKVVPWPDTMLDHPDHVHASMFAFAAAQRYAGASLLRTYRGYDTAMEAANGAENMRHNGGVVFYQYGVEDAKICVDSESDLDDDVHTFVTNSQQLAKLCLDPADAGTPVSECELLYGDYVNNVGGSVYSDTIMLGADGQTLTGMIKAPENTCLSASSIASGVPVHALTCNTGSATQQWKVLSNGSLQLTNSGLCLASNSLDYNSSLVLQNCSSDPTQNFLITSTHQLRGPDGSCVTKTTGSSALSIKACEYVTHTPNQRPYVLALPQPPFAAATAGFSTTQVPNSRSYYGSLSYANVDGNPGDDVCVRRSDGIYCAFFDGSSFTGYKKMLNEFTNTGLSQLPDAGATVQLADIDGDGRADICGRGTHGISCATHTVVGNVFDGNTFSLRSYGTNFSDDEYDDDAQSRYLSIRVIDVNNDGYADACGRTSAGIECALNDQNGYFEEASPWITSSFTDLDVPGMEEGWDSLKTGATLMFGDINGDEWNDVCGRSIRGIMCALNVPHENKFDLPRLWSFSRYDFTNDLFWHSNEANYGSIGLADINGDGRADICGRSNDGIVCGLSQGSTFARVAPLLGTGSYSNSAGFSNEAYGSTLAFPDLNGDGRADVCARGPLPSPNWGVIGLLCNYGFPQ